uniref:Uncharacterized protein n=1 Tax=Syphacia muris TaxID=451379 RepID=A0A0N5AYX6_9BILA
MNGYLRKPCAMLQYSCQRFCRLGLLFDNLSLISVLFIYFIFIGSHYNFIAAAHTTSFIRTPSDSLNQHTLNNSKNEVNATKISAPLLGQLLKSESGPGNSVDSLKNKPFTQESTIRYVDFVNDDNDTIKLQNSSNHSSSLFRTDHDRLEKDSEETKSHSASSKQFNFRPYEQPNGFPYLSKANSAGRHFLNLINRKSLRKRGSISRYLKFRNEHNNNILNGRNKCSDTECQVKSEEMRTVREKKESLDTPLVIISSAYGSKTNTRATDNVDRLRSSYLGRKLSGEEPVGVSDGYSDSGYYSLSQGYSRKGYSGSGHLKASPETLYEAAVIKAHPLEDLGIDAGMVAFKNVPPNTAFSEIYTEPEETSVNITKSQIPLAVSSQQQLDSDAQNICISLKSSYRLHNITDNQFLSLCGSNFTSTNATNPQSVPLHHDKNEVS